MSCRSIPAPTRSSADHGRERAARAGRHSGRIVGGVGCRRPHPEDRPRQWPPRRRRSGSGTNPSALAAGAGALWVASEEAGRSPGSTRARGRVVQAIPVGSGAERGGRRRGRGVGRQPPGRDPGAHRPRAQRVTWSDAVGSDPTAVAVGEGAVWVAGGEEGPSSRSTPTARASSSGGRPGSSPAAITVAGGSVWAAADAPRSAHRGGTLRVLIPSSPKPSQTLDWLDPQALQGLGGVQSRVTGLRRPGRLPARGGCSGRDDRRGVGDRRCRRRVATARATSSHYVADSATRTGGRSARPTSGPRWSASCRPCAPSRRTSGCRTSTRASSARGDAWPRMIAATCHVGSKRTRRRAPSAFI